VPKRTGAASKVTVGVSILVTAAVAIGGYLHFRKHNARGQVVRQASTATRPAAAPPQSAPKISQGVLDGNTMFTVYGRSFGVAPILGRLGQYRDMDDMARGVEQHVTRIDALNGDKGVMVAIHLIYAMATPCTGPKDECLYYVEGTARNLIENYIEPAARRGWAVILDTQLGRSNPVAQVKRMLDKGYLKYDNVHIALDPEFRTLPGRNRPGIPIGSVQSSEINAVQQMLASYVRSERLASRKVLMVHQFGDPAVRDGVPSMIGGKEKLRRFPDVDLVIAMDGLGSPSVKTKKYNAITDPVRYPFLQYRGMKIFYPNRWEKHGHFDTPPMTMDQVMGTTPASPSFTVLLKPDVITIAGKTTGARLDSGAAGSACSFRCWSL
jgi:hypothetical protein